VLKSGWPALAVVAILLLGGSGCAGSSRSDRAEPAPAVTTTGPSVVPTPWVALPGLGRCGPQPPALAGVRYRQLTLRAPGRRLAAVTTGSGRTVVVLVHQTDGGGLCGWLDFAARVAAVPGQRAIAFDLCGWGDSACAEGNATPRRQVQQVRQAIDEAERLGARRIVVVGASMGGSLAVLTAAVDGRVDAAVDLSGPDEWRDAVVHRHAPGVPAPLLVVMADDEGPEAVAVARDTAQAARAGEFVGAERGHGYELLTDASSGDPSPLAERVLAWIASP
jgi:pimeloyl-ACP methyl ester carboxylesterase